MLFSEFFCVFVTYLTSISCTYSMEITNSYECGAHGKFEYCINDSPDCVIGCHCYPGYYFDTDTKICEPNTKLAGAARQDSHSQSLGSENTSNNRGKADEVTRDTDELGDWLYNQFFKTIENQAINNTNEEPKMSGSDVLPSIGNTRRSNSKLSEGNDLDFSKIKTRKSLRGRGKKRKKKGHSLKKKLLRITEDDSLFDSESDSQSDDDYSDSSSSSDEESKEEGTGHGGGGGGGSDGNTEHGHKKVIIFNKRPRPPLPSFIFVPSMDTPYYPPIGLPPPPPLPMYPMVPIPPMAPYYPYLDPNKPNPCDQGASGTTTTTSANPTSASSTAATTVTTSAKAETTPNHSEQPTESSTAETTTPNAETPPTQTEGSSPPAEETPSTEPEALRMLRHHMRQKMFKPRKSLKRPSGRDRPESSIMMRSSQARKSQQFKDADRMNLVKHLKEMIQNERNNKHINYDTHEDIPNGSDEYVPFDQIPVGQDSSAYSPIIKRKHKMKKNELKNLEDVNFKYISQLIHRPKENPNQTNISQIPEPQMRAMPLTRRNNGPETTIERKGKSSTPRKGLSDDDKYYSNLGRQIASLIRDVNAVDSNVETDNDNIDLILRNWELNNNNYESRTSWDRSIRSPLGPFSKTNRHDHEQNLFNLENAVKSFARTISPPSLQDLENILNTAHRKQTTKKIIVTTEKYLNMFNFHNRRPVTMQLKYKQYVHLKNHSRNMPSTQKSNTTNSNVSDYTNLSQINLLNSNKSMFDFIPAWNKNRPEQKPGKNISFDRSNQNSLQLLSKSYSKQNNQQSKILKALFNMVLPTTSNANKPEVRVKYREVVVPEKSHESPENFREMLPRYPERRARHFEEPEKYLEFPVKNRIEVGPAKYDDFPGKYLKNNVDKSSNNPEVFPKFSDIPGKYYRNNAMTYHLNPTLLNYKSTDYFIDSENNHYMVQAAYPIEISTYKSKYQNHLDPDSGKPSYFDHAFQNFDTYT